MSLVATEVHTKDLNPATIRFGQLVCRIGLESTTVRSCMILYHSLFASALNYAIATGI